MLENVAAAGLAMKASQYVGEQVTNELSEQKFVLPGAEYHSGGQDFEAGVDDLTIETGVFRTQTDYNRYLESQGLGAGINRESFQNFGPVAPGEPSAEDQQLIGQAFATGDPVVDKGDGWYSMVYSGDGSNSMDSARVLPCDYKMNEDGSIGIRGTEPMAYLEHDRFGLLQPKDKYDFEQWKEQTLTDNPDWRSGNNTVLLERYAQDCVDTQHEITTYPDRRDPAQLNQMLYEGMQTKEAEKASLSASGAGVPDVEATKNGADLGATAESIAATGTNIQQELAQLLKQLLAAMDKQFGTSFSTDNQATASNDYQAATSERLTVDTTKLDGSRGAQSQNDYSVV